MVPHAPPRVEETDLEQLKGGAALEGEDLCVARVLVAALALLPSRRRGRRRGGAGAAAGEGGPRAEGEAGEQHGHCLSTFGESGDVDADWRVVGAMRRSSSQTAEYGPRRGISLFWSRGWGGGIERNRFLWLQVENSRWRHGVPGGKTPAIAQEYKRAVPISCLHSAPRSFDSASGRLNQSNALSTDM